MPAQLIVWLIIACIVLMVVIAISGSGKGLARIAVQSMAGICGILVANWAFQPLGLSVGINLISALITGVLGLPGFLTLYLTQVIL